MKMLLDTNAYSQLRRGNVQVAELMREAEEVLLSAVVVGELMYGFRRGSRFERNIADLLTFLGNPYVTFVPVGQSRPTTTPELRHHCEPRGRQSPPTMCGLRPIR